MNKISMKDKFITKNSFSPDEKIKMLSILENYGCKNIYLHHAIYANYDKFIFILPNFYENDTPEFISAYNKSNGELHFFAINDEGVSKFNYILFSTNNLNDIGKGIQYLGTDIINSKKLFSYNPGLFAKIIEINEYYVYTLRKEKFLNNYNDLVKFINNDENLKFCFAISKRDIIKLLNLQKGYLTEEMQYPSQILSDKFIFLNLQKILKYFKLFYIERDNIAVAKCEWNAFSNKIFQIGGVYVAPQSRNRHYGYSLLFKMLYHSFENLNMEEASLFVRMSNLKAQKLYEKLLFEKYKDNLIWALLKSN